MRTLQRLVFGIFETFKERADLCVIQYVAALDCGFARPLHKFFFQKILFRKIYADEIAGNILKNSSKFMSVNASGTADTLKLSFENSSISKPMFESVGIISVIKSNSCALA